MKTLLTVLIACLFFSAAAQSFAPPGAKWWYGVSGLYYGFSYTTVEVVGDTVLLNKPCRVIQVNDVYCSPSLAKYVYEDSSRLFVYHNGYFNKVYDFNLNIGDTWTLTYFDTFEVYRTIIDTSSVSVNGNNLRILEVKDSLSPNSVYNHPFENTLVEKVGNVSALFHVNYYWWFYGISCDGEYAGNLRCYYDDSIGLYKRVNIECDSIWIGVEEPTLNQSINIYPNPVINDINLTCNNCTAYTISLHTLNGKQLWQKPYANSVALDGLKPGVYLLTISEGAGKFTTKKLVKL